MPDGVDECLQKRYVLLLKDWGNKLGVLAEAAVAHRLPVASLGDSDGPEEHGTC